MSIRDEISYEVQEGRLFYMPPLIPSALRPRELFVSTGIEQAAWPPWPSDKAGLRLAGMRASFDAYSSGSTITVAMDPFKKKKESFFAPIDPVSDCCWDMRCLAPNPGIRVFGHFADTDLFVALVWDHRENLENERDWRDAVQRSKALWRTLFKTYPPHQGATINDYVSINFDIG